MHRLWTLAIIFTQLCLFFFLPLTAADLTSTESAKMDPALKLVLPLKQERLQKHRGDFVLSVSDDGQSQFELLIKFDGAAADLQVPGATIMTAVGPIATARATTDGVYNLARCTAVKRMQLAQYHTPCLDVSRISTGVDKLYTGNPLYRGNGVIVGVFDSGIDWRHEDFIDRQGQSRILSLWDVTDDGGPHPAGFDYGTEYTQAQITDEIDGSPNGLVREKDLDGHGTHVAGIAAGDGSATGNGVDAYTYVGMAPQADLIFVKGGADGYSTTNEVNGLSYIIRKAREFGRPVVVNYSIGGHWGAHDGTDLAEQAIDAAAEAGQIVVVAASNDGDTPIHASGTVARNRSLVTTFQVKEDATYAWVTIWHSGSDRMQIVITTPEGYATPAQSSGSLPEWTYWNTSSGRIGLIAPEKNSDNHDYELTIYLDNEDGSAVQTGEWQFELTGIQISNGRFDAWTKYVKAEFTSNIDYSRLIGIPGTAREAITVASYCTKNSWTAIDGGEYSYNNTPTLWDLSAFSSMGPTRDGREKPEITAPGHGIVSTLSSDADASRSRIVADGVHQLMQGTSMAAPHVTGAVALLLEKNPSLTPDQAKAALIESAWVDDYTSAVWNNGWGNGKLEIDEAIKRVEGSISGTFGQISAGKVSCGLTDWGGIGTTCGAEPGFQFAASGSADHGYGGSLVAAVLEKDVADSYGGLDQIGDDIWRTCANGRMRLIKPGLISDQDGSAEFEKQLLTPTGLTRLRVHQNSYAWASSPYDQFVILDFELTNLGPHDLTNLILGYYMDWDCQPNSSTNEAGYASDLNLAYMWDNGTTDNPFLGTCMLHPSPVSFDIINNALSVYDDGDLPDEVMFNLMSSPGFMNGIGAGDLSTLLAAPQINLPEGKSSRFSIALVAGTDLTDLRRSASRAREKFTALDRRVADLYYDDGSAEGGMHFTQAGERAAVRFSPASYPATLRFASFYTRAVNAGVKLQLYDDRGVNGSPGKALLAAPISVIPRADSWNLVDLSSANLIIASGDFYISLEWTDGSGPYLGYDEEYPYAQRSWSFEGGKWANFALDGDPWDKRDLLIGAGLDRATKILTQDGEKPKTFALSPNYPNPFNPMTTLDYEVAELSHVEITIYNLLGQKIKLLLDEMQSPGFYQVRWNGRDQSEQPVAAGIYFCLLKTPQLQIKRRLLLLR